ncbi:MAG: DNA-3-methyladenine glycosylase 2 family protein [Bacteroidota bacterium]
MIVNTTATENLIQLDPQIAMIHERYGVPPGWSRPAGFVSLSKIILEQQVSLASAVAHFNKLKNYMGGFTPELILSLSDEELRACHISRQKSAYLRGLALAVSGGTLKLEELHLKNEDEIRSALTALKGIGEWTTDVYLMFCMGSPDIFPIGDIALVNTMKELYGHTSKEEMTEYAERWRPYRSLATQFMWHYYLKKRNRVFPFEGEAY